MQKGVGRIGSSCLMKYKTTPHTSIGESPFQLTYGVDVVILAEIGEPTQRTTNMTLEDNDDLQRSKRNLEHERRDVAIIWQAALKVCVVTRYNKHVIPHNFQEDLVLRKNYCIRKTCRLKEAR